MSALALALGSAPAPAAEQTLQLPAGHRSTEAHVALDPTNARDVLVLARDEDRSQGVGLRQWRSSDAGRRFRMSMLVDRRIEGARADASDPVALFDARGRPAPAYLALRYGQSRWDSRIVLGDRVVARDEHPPPFPSIGEGFGLRRWHDKPWAAIDPRDGYAYVTWTMRESTETEPIERIAVTSARAGEPFPAYRFLGSGNGAQPVIGRGSTVIVVWYERPNLSNTARILSARSLDRGVTWSAPAVVAAGVPALGDPPFPTVVRSGAGFVACWQGYSSFRRGRIACSRSSDGARWSAPVSVISPRSGGAGQPALAAGPGGRLWLAFYRYDSRATWVELWSSRSDSRTWRRRATLTRRAVPASGWYFLGDYQGLVATRDRVIAAFVMPVRARGFRQEVVVVRHPVRSR